MLGSESQISGAWNSPGPARPGVVLITGAARRIGRAIALELAGAGWAVGVHYNKSVQEAEEVVDTIASQGGRAIAVGCDLGDAEAVEGLVPRAAEELGPLTCLINNASVFAMDTIATLTRESWQRHIEPNLWAPLALSQAFARQLPEGEQGNIINLLDQRVWKLTPYFISYTVSKMGLWTLTRTLALGLAPRIRVNGIGPGPILPNDKQDEQQFKDLCAAVPLGHGASPEEIAQAVRFILAAPAMTGQMIALDGGEHLSWALPYRGNVYLEK